MAFMIYFVVRSPVESANAVKGVAQQIGDFANALVVSITTFLRTLF